MCVYIVYWPRNWLRRNISRDDDEKKNQQFQVKISIAIFERGMQVDRSDFSVAVFLCMFFFVELKVLLVTHILLLWMSLLTSLVHQCLSVSMHNLSIVKLWTYWAKRCFFCVVCMCVCVRAQASARRVNAAADLHGIRTPKTAITNKNVSYIQKQTIKSRWRRLDKRNAHESYWNFRLDRNVFQWLSYKQASKREKKH